MSRNTPVKGNFKNMQTDNMCSLGCPEIETQQHLLGCLPILKKKKNLTSVVKSVNYGNLFGTVKTQKIAMIVFKDLIRIQNELLED